MINCVDFVEVATYLREAGYAEVGRGERFIAFEHENGSSFTIRPPNTDGHLPEAVVNDAFYAAELTPPDWHVFWCD